MEELDSLLQVIGSPAYFFDTASLKLLSVNGSFAELMECDQSELIGLTVRDLGPPEDWPKLARALAQSPPEGSVEWRYKTRTQKILYVRISYRNSLFYDKASKQRHDIRLVVVFGWNSQPLRSSDDLFG